MPSDSTPISLAGSHLGEVRHVCAFFSSDDEEYRVLLPFMKDGFACGHKALHVVNPDQEEDHRCRLASAGVDTSAAEARGQLEVRSNTTTYLTDGRFDQNLMLHAFTQIASGNSNSGYPLSRIVCRMDWADVDRRVFEEVLEFESRINDLWRQHDDVVICTYRLNRLDGDAVVDVMRTHPMIILGGVLRINPFFIAPDVFLAEYRSRRAHPSSAPAGG